MVKVAGYKQMQADVTKEQVRVEFDPKQTNPQVLAEAITKYSEFKGSVISGK